MSDRKDGGLVVKNPIQPIVIDTYGVVRFKQNKIVRDLLDFATSRGLGLNELACMDYSNDDRQQFAQLIGYSLHGYGELTNYVDDDAYNAAEKMAEGMPEDKARIAALQTELDAVRQGLVGPMSRLFGVHPDDLLSEREGSQ